MEKPLLVIIGIAGTATIYDAARPFGPNSMVAGYLSTWDESPDVKAAIAAGVPAIDMRTMPEESAIEFSFRGPMLDQGDRGNTPDIFADPDNLGLDGCGFNSMQYAPARVLIDLARQRGATIHNA